MVWYMYGMVYEWYGICIMYGMVYVWYVFLDIKDIFQYIQFKKLYSNIFNYNMDAIKYLLLFSLVTNNLTYYGRRHFKLFTNFHVSQDTLYHVNLTGRQKSDVLIQIINSKPLPALFFKNKKHEIFFIEQVFLRNSKTAVEQIQFQIGQNGNKIISFTVTTIAINAKNKLKKWRQMIFELIFSKRMSNLKNNFLVW